MFEAQVKVVTLVVKDQAAAVKFYTGQVGMETRTDLSVPGRNRWVTVGAKDSEVEFSLYQMGSALDDAETALTQHWAPATAPGILFSVANCQRSYDEPVLEE